MRARKLTPLKVTATQRLGRRVDSLEATTKGLVTRVEGLAQRVQELSQTFAETAHSGNWEAMYRMERLESVRLQLLFEGEGPREEERVGLATLQDWIAQLQNIVHRLRPAAQGLATSWPCGCRIRGPGFNGDEA